MIAQRVGVAAMRRGATKPNVFFNQTVPRLILASSPSMTQSRLVATAKLSNDEGHQILANQRLNRPISPHLGIYKMEQTWFGASAWTRITGCALSGAAYAYFASYLVAPLLGLHLESASLAAAFAGLPFLAKGAVKFALGFPFAFHFINGIKHLVYDLGKGFSKPTIKRGEIALWVSSILSGLYLAFGL
ncbi:succinate dehydrogenase/Fumarate reductase transmembrane subunit [Hirsutella rhossiliensis]|uniref:Succinate dehydrogenase/Fumarate reductase transmembrane subunit domain-containing protein n=1 Tax=Hirsutella rhossiliensis TaxID=111463 RepID=A0A9P8N6W0_9HYPO|nr:succinate dehydrogenase/Fumarate reductase transmembrane subunit domain-containing protein [Hirsutella rhossiliensis]KAH0967854.1 succinate dehydrogenase/Fumarate reductase transmembrane subunit domain-containing protein [Hirsutella rhossiliensis]